MESDWGLMTGPTPPSNAARVVVAGENPVLVLERFGRLVAASAEVSADRLRLVVDPVNTTAPVIRPRRVRRSCSEHFSARGDPLYWRCDLDTE